MIIAHKSNNALVSNLISLYYKTNITGEILVRLAPDIPKNMKRSGALILSGIIESRLAMVKDAFLSQGLQVVKQRQKGDWFALVLRFASSAAETSVSGAGDGEEEK